MALIVCAMLLLTLAYFATLIVYEVALWVSNRLPQADPRPLTA